MALTSHKFPYACSSMPAIVCAVWLFLVVASLQVVRDLGILLGGGGATAKFLKSGEGGGGNDQMLCKERSGNVNFDIGVRYFGGPKPFSRGCVNFPHLLAHT